MPRDGSGVFSAPAGTKGVAGTAIQSAPYNAWIDDLVADANAERPVTAGGTGAGTAVGAHDAIVTKGTDIASAATLNLDNATGANVNVTGTTTVTAVTLTAGRQRLARATGAFQMTASASLIVNGSTTVNYTTTAGDLLMFEGYASSVVRVWLVGTNGTPVTLEKAQTWSGGQTINANVSVGDGTDISPSTTPTGQLIFRGSAYHGYVALDATGMHIGNNSSSRNLTLDINETTVMTVTANGIAAPLGSASAPSYSFTGDSNTGMYSVGADTIGFSTAGVKAGEINSSGDYISTRHVAAGSAESATGANSGIRMIYTATAASIRSSTTATTTQTHSLYYNPNGAVGSVTTAASGTTFNTTSDYRLKSDIVDLAGSGTFIDALRPRQFTMAGVAMAGFVAHEFAAVSPMSVSGEKDAVDAEGNPVYQAMQASTSEVMANVVAELQSLRARVAVLEAGPI